MKEFRLVLYLENGSKVCCGWADASKWTIKEVLNSLPTIKSGVVDYEFEYR